LPQLLAILPGTARMALGSLALLDFLQVVRLKFYFEPIPFFLIDYKFKI
jgi:hypothetical protein